MEAKSPEIQAEDMLIPYQREIEDLENCQKLKEAQLSTIQLAVEQLKVKYHQYKLNQDAQDKASPQGCKILLFKASKSRNDWLIYKHKAGKLDHHSHISIIIQFCLNGAHKFLPWMVSSINMTIFNYTINLRPFLFSKSIKKIDNYVDQSSYHFKKQKFVKLYQYSLYSVEMKAVTWQKDSHGLFDYETKSLSVKKYRVDSACKIFRNEQEIILVDSKSPTKEEVDQKFLTQVIQIPTNSEQNFYINPSQIPSKEDPQGENDNYLIVRSLKNKEGVQKGYTLEPGDILRLGRIEYAVIEFREESGKVHSIKDLFCTDAQLVQHMDLSNTTQKTCKICLFEEQTEENPFISPCKCKGSCEFVHFECQKQWIESRGYKKQSGNTFIYKWKKLDCEVCQEPLPKRIQISGRTLDLADLERPDSSYIILESISKEKKVSKGIYLIKSPFEEPIKLGRGHQCEIRISDISVSRLHAFIKYENGNFIIIDNNSKFGTLVRLTKPFLVQQDKIAVQIGRTVLTFVLKAFSPSSLGNEFGSSKLNINSNSKNRLIEKQLPGQHQTTISLPQGISALTKSNPQNK